MPERAQSEEAARASEERVAGPSRAQSETVVSGSARAWLRLRRGQRGLAVMLVMIVLGVLMVIGALGAGMLTGNLRIAGIHRGAARAQYCAEAGLVAGRTWLLSNIGNVNAYFFCNQGGACPAGYPLTGSAATDGGAPYEVRVFDNFDELPPAADNPLLDNDLTVILQSRCTDANLPPRQVRQHVTFDINLVPDYRSQAGFGRGHTGNQN